MGTACPLKPGFGFRTRGRAVPAPMETLCLRRSNGQMLWRRSADVQQIESLGQAATADFNPAASTPATDGTHACPSIVMPGLLSFRFTLLCDHRIRVERLCN